VDELKKELDGLRKKRDVSCGIIVFYGTGIDRWDTNSIV